jgi:putative aldouronate transport system substrate-binding protein
MKKLMAIVVFVLSFSLLMTTMLVPTAVNAATKEKVSISIFMPRGGGPELTVTDKAGKAAWEKAENIEINYQLQPSSNYLEKLQLMFVSGTYPDVVIFNSHNDATFGKLLKQGAENGVFIPVNKYLTNSNTPNIMKYSYKSAMESTKVLNNDNMYLIPRTTVKRVDGFSVRLDWLKKVGLKNINEGSIISMDQFTEILKRFTENDPDGNGKNDTVGFSTNALANGNVGIINTIGTAFGYKGWENYSDGGKYKYMKPDLSIQGNSKKIFSDVVNYMAALYKKGYIDPNWPLVKDSSSLQTKGYAGVITLFAGNIKKIDNILKKVNPKGQLTYIAGIKDQKTGKFYGAGYDAGIFGGIAITSACKKPERVINAFDWILGDEGWKYVKYGPEGVTYNKTTKGIVTTAKYVSEKPATPLNALLRRNNDPEFFVDMTLTATEKIKTRKWIDKAMNGIIDSKDNGFRPEIADDAAYIEAENQRLQMLTKTLLGVATFTDYQNNLKNWYAKGGDTYIKQVNDFIVKNENK